MRRCLIGIILALVVLFLFSGCRKDDKKNIKQTAIPEESLEEPEIKSDPLAISERIPVYEKLLECGLTLENPTGLPFFLDNLTVEDKNDMLHTSYSLYYGDATLYSDVEKALTKAYGSPVDSFWNVHQGSVGLGNTGGMLVLNYEYPLTEFDFGKAVKELTPNGVYSVPFNSTNAVQTMQMNLAGDFEWITFTAYDQTKTSVVLEAYEKMMAGLGLKILTDEEVSGFDMSLRQNGYWVTKHKSASYEVFHREEQYDPQRIDSIMLNISDKSDFQDPSGFPENATTYTLLHIEGQTMFEGALPGISVAEEPEAVSESAVSSVQKQAAGEVIKVDTLKAAYAEDEKNPGYTDKTITIRGIMRISLVEMDDFVTMVFNGNENTPPVIDVKCFFSRKAAPEEAALILELEGLKSYTVTGTCKGLAGNSVILTDCTLNEDQ